MSQQPLEVSEHVSGQANKPMSAPAHALTFQQVAEELGANLEDGLTDGEAKNRLEEYGRNEFGAEEGVQPLKIFIGQIANALTLVLILAMAASFGIQSWIEGGVVAAVIILNIVVGFFQEFQAAKTMDSLRSLSSPTAHAVRGGNNETVVTAEIVPGDMVELKTGDTIPADIRLVEAVNFETNEALLTGESLPVRKDVAAIFAEDTGPGDRLNVAYSSSTVTKGRARGIVFATGMYTEIGQIAAALRGKSSRRREPKRRADGTTHIGRWMEAWTLTFSDAVGRFLGVNVGTPLQRKLSKLAILLLGTAIICAIIVLGANEFSAKREVIIYAVATGLSMIPASLIVVLTITMAAGTKRMVQRHVIVRNLKSLEALGGVTNICSDKTGTLTQGNMIVKKAWIPGRGTYSVGSTSEPFNPTVGDLGFKEAQPKDINFQENDAEGTLVNAEDLVARDKTLQEYLNVASLANLATVHMVNNEWHARGDPTEIAMQVFASRFDWNRLRLSTGEKARWHEVAEFPFDSDVKKMSVIFEDKQTQKQWVFTKGAVERVLTSCPRYSLGDEVKEFTDDIKDEVLRNMEALARLGLRVLALASRTDIRHVKDNEAELDRGQFEHNLIFRTCFFLSTFFFSSSSVGRLIVSPGKEKKKKKRRRKMGAKRKKSEGEELLNEGEKENDKNNENSSKKMKKEILPSMIKNKEKRSAVHAKLKHQKKVEKRKKLKARDAAEKRALELGEEPPARKTPHTIENTREPDETVCRPDDDELFAGNDADEFSSILKQGCAPKILITTCRFNSSRGPAFISELLAVIPNSHYYKRGTYDLKKIIEYAKKKDFTSIIVVHTNRREPDALLIIGLPDGPTAHFKLSKLVLRKDIKNHGNPTGHIPELVLNNFATRLGHRVGRLIQSLFPQSPEFRGRRVVTFHNQRDFIFFRHHRYIFETKESKGSDANGKKAKGAKSEKTSQQKVITRLQECGPRFTLKLVSLQHGTFDTKGGEFEWVHKPEMDTSRRRFFL